VARLLPAWASFLQLTEAQQVLVVVRVAYDADRVPLEAVFNAFPSQQWRLSYEWTVS
jgi:GntR family transcriptional regulator